MGLVKQAWIEEQERGWSAPDTHVCHACVNDAHLKQLVREAASVGTCSYCGRRRQSAPTEVVVEAVASAVSRFYSEPTEAGVPYDRGFLIESTSTQNVLLGLPFHAHDTLFEDVVDAFHNDYWVPSRDGHWAGLQERQVLVHSWQAFARAVKHQTRFHFATAYLDHDDEDHESIAPRHMLASLGRVIQGLHLIQVVPAGATVYRARGRNATDTWQPNKSTMGAPPSDKASAGRMNPAGISYLYTAFNQATALCEVGAERGSAVMATFEVKRDLVVVDFTRLPALPSIFDGAKAHEYEQILFASQFVADISKPVEKDGREHIDYVPTQVVSEWLAQAFRAEGLEGRVDGLVYPSAVAAQGRNLVLFPTTRSYAREFDQVEFLRARRV